MALFVYNYYVIIIIRYWWCHYENGYGVDESYLEAMKWYERSLSLGFGEALENINRLKEDMKNDISFQLEEISKLIDKKEKSGYDLLIKLNLVNDDMWQYLL